MSLSLQDQFIDYFRGSLKASDKAAFEEKLANSPYLQEDFNKQLRIFNAMGQIASESYSGSEQLTRSVMESVSAHEGLSVYSTIVRIASKCVLITFVALLAIAMLLAIFLSTNPDMTAVLLYIEGSFGALIMLIAGISAILATCIGRYRSAGGLLAASLAVFFLRASMTTFFNDESIRDGGSSQRVVNAVLSGGQVFYNDQRITSTRNYQIADTKSVDESKRVYVVTRAISDKSDEYWSLAENGERYGEYLENPSFETRTQAFSTFASDVDTASYTNIRRFIRLGQLPPPTAVRTEEMINYFSYSYPEPAKDEKFSLSYEIAPSPFKSDYHLLKLGLKAQTVTVDPELGWNLVFLVDVSGSMTSSDKLPLVKESLKALAARMRPSDRVAIVTYAGDAGIKLNSTSGGDKTTINQAIDSLVAGGSTNGAAGIDAAYQIAAANFRKGGVNRVVLATDGDFNVGNYSFDGLMELIEKKRESGVTLTTLGFGTGNTNDHMMEQLADKGNGNYFYVDSFQEARKIFEEKLLSTVELVAKDTKIQVEFNPAVVREYRLIGFDNRKLNKQDFTDDSKDAGDVGAGGTVTALYEILLADSKRATSGDTSRYLPVPQVEAPISGAHMDELGTFKIRFKEPESSSSMLKEIPLLKGEIKEFNQTTIDNRFAVAVAMFGQFLRKSTYDQKIDLAKVREIATEAKGGDNDQARGEFIRLVDDVISIVNNGR